MEIGPTIEENPNRTRKKMSDFTITISWESPLTRRRCLSDFSWKNNTAKDEALTWGWRWLGLVGGGGWGFTNHKFYIYIVNAIHNFTLENN